jgi:hypothetical protein
LRQLRPIRQALFDPHFTVMARPLDSAWHYHGVTGSMGGFNPLTHTHYYPVRSILHRWLTEPEDTRFSPEENYRLAKEVLLFAHDYLHSWAYRALCHLDPSFRFSNPATRDELATQAFFLIVTEAVAVTGLDYWYLSLRGISQRCGTDFDLGPCTVHYREKLLSEYRRSNPELTVQRPGFFVDVVRLYSQGVIAGFSEQDLFDSRPLADWLIRELLIAPRQREVSQLWLSQMSGLDVNVTQLREPLNGLLETHHQTVTVLGELLWQKIKHGAHYFFPPPEVPHRWSFAPTSEIDFRFANVNWASGRRIAWVSKPDVTECWRFYVDQMVSARAMPKETVARDALAGQVEDVKRNLDRDALARLTEMLPAIDYPDRAPLELLFVN